MMPQIRSKRSRQIDESGLPRVVHRLMLLQGWEQRNAEAVRGMLSVRLPSLGYDVASSIARGSRWTLRGF